VDPKSHWEKVYRTKGTRCVRAPSGARRQARRSRHRSDVRSRRAYQMQWTKRCSLRCQCPSWRIRCQLSTG